MQYRNIQVRERAHKLLLLFLLLLVRIIDPPAQSWVPVSILRQPTAMFRHGRQIMMLRVSRSDGAGRATSKAP